MHRPIASYRTTAQALLVLIITSLFFFYGFGLNNIFNALEAPLSQTYGLTPSQMGWISSLYFWANVVSLMPMGALTDRYSPKKVIIGAFLLSIVTVVVIAYAHNVWLLAVSRLLMGVGGGCVFVGCMRIAANWFDLAKLARVAAIIVTMGMFGGFMVQSPYIALINLVGWRESLLVIAVIGVVFVALIALIVKDHPEGLEETFHEERSGISVGKSIAMALKNKQNWLAGFAGSLNNLPIFMLGALWGVPYLMKVHGLTNTQAGTVCGMLYFGTMVGSPIMGTLSDHFKRRKLPMILGIIFSIIIIELVTHAPSSSMWVLCSLFFLLGMGASAQVLAYPIVAESNHHTIISTATSIISMLMLLGGAVSEPLFGWVVEQSGVLGPDGQYTSLSYVTAIEILPVAFVLSLFVAIFIRETKAERLN